MLSKDDFEAIVDELHDEEAELIHAGQAEYARSDDNSLANFERIGSNVKCVCEHCGKPTRIGRAAVLMTFFLKHVDGMLSWISGHRSQREDVRGRINDGRLYLALFRGMVEDDE